jgi:hypothetical protein
VRWFRLTGIPASERLAALRLQVEAWQPFAKTAGRLALTGDEGLAVVWDDAAVRQQLLAAGLAPERCQLLPDVLMQAAAGDGLRLVRGLEGYEAQSWQDGVLRASRWWAEPLQARDWQEFVHASGVRRDVQAPDAGVQAVPEPQAMAVAPAAWVRHHPLHASGDASNDIEQRAALAGVFVLTVAAGALAHQAWGAYDEGRRLTQQIAETRASAATVLTARDATMAAVNEVEAMAGWFSAPQPIDVIAHLHDALGRSGVLVKDLDLEGDKLRLALQLGPNTTRAGIVKDLQAGGWLTDVAEVRADNARGLLTMEMRVAGAKALRTMAADVPASPSPAPRTGDVANAVSERAAAPIPAPAAAPAQVAATPPRAAPSPARTPVAIPVPASVKPTKDDPLPIPPDEVFNAIPSR